MNYHIRRLNLGEFALYRQVRLASLREAPEAFCTTLESALGRDDACWIAQADGAASGPDRAIFVLLTEESVGLGVAALYRESASSGHGELCQVWVAPAFRGTKAAVDLLDAVFDWAATQGFEKIRAEVIRGNHRALRFYQQYGFAAQPSPPEPNDEPLVFIRGV